MLKELRAEKERRDSEALRQVDVFGLLGYVPTPKQAEFHAATEFSILFGGSAGGGKSKALTVHAIRECVRHPGIRVGAFRRTYGELKESLLAELAQAGYAQALGARWNGTEYELRFPNGSLLMFRYAETLADATRRQGGQYQLLLFDEATLVSPDVLSFLESRLRSGRSDLPVLGVRATANPGGPGHGAIRERFIDATNYGEKVVTDKRGRTVRFIPSKLSDNPHVNPEYAADLLALPETQRSAFLDGNWDAFAGMMYPELSADRHRLAPITLPASWKRYIGVDWGYSKPWAVIWAAADEDGRVWLYREVYATQVGEAEQARRILAAEADGEHITARFADDAMWATRGDAKPIADVYADNGVHLTRAGKGAGSRVIGWQRIHSYLAEGPACPHHRTQGWATCPMLHVFTTCENWWKEMRDLPHAMTGDPEDADTHAPDHLCLAPGTMVATNRGPVPIERVVAGDEVWTRQGLRPVVGAGTTTRGALIGRVVLSNGAVIRGTAGHPVWVTGRGWVRLDALRYSDTIEQWENEPPDAWKPLSSTASRSGGTLTRSSAPTGCTSLPVSAIASSGLEDFIRRSGKPLTAQSRMGTTSTTRTRTLSTTLWTTWSAFPEETTSGNTPTSPNGSPTVGGPSRLPAKLPPSGTGRQRAENGTGNSGDRSGKGAGLRSLSASSADRATEPGRSRGITSFARHTASTAPGLPPGWTTKPGPASYAVSISGSTSTSRSGVAPVRVRCGWLVEQKRSDVYNLTVEGAHEFYANGVLVHNCDASRYLLTNLGSGPDFPILGAAPDPQKVEPVLAPQQTFVVIPNGQEPAWTRDSGGIGSVWG